MVVLVVYMLFPMGRKVMSCCFYGISYCIDAICQGLYATVFPLVYGISHGVYIVSCQFYAISLPFGVCCFLWAVR